MFPLTLYTPSVSVCSDVERPKQNLKTGLLGASGAGLVGMTANRLKSFGRAEDTVYHLAPPAAPADIVGSRPTAAKSNIRRHPATTKLG